jgi:4-amino-4-deoxy-L-arabinose transferase-like glycosyltransferase
LSISSALADDGVGDLAPRGVVVHTAARRHRSHTPEFYALGVLLIFVVLFWRLGEPTLWDPDEAHYAESSREMAASGDWLAPHYNGEPFFDKPALFHVFQAGAVRALGPTEFAVRIVPALAGLALVAATIWFGAAVDSMEVGEVAGLIVAGSPGLFALARYAILDTLFTSFEFGGVALLAIAALGRRSRLQYPGYVLIALATLTKGPLAIVLAGLTFLIAIAVSRDARRRLLGLRWVLGVGIVLAIAAPWFVYMYVRFQSAFVSGYVLDENLRLYASSRFDRQPGPLFYLQVLGAGLLPWTGLVAGRFVDDIRRLWKRERLDTLEILLWAWTFAIVGFFSLSTFKLDHYVFPAAPALALLCARAWSDVRRDPMDPRHAGVRLGLHLVGPLLVAIGLGAGVFLIARLQLPRAAVLVPLVVAAAGAVLTALVNIKGAKPPRAPWIVSSSMLVIYIGIVLFVMPALEHRKVVPDLARWVAAHTRPSDRVAMYRLNRWTSVFRFYVDRNTAHLETPEQAHEFFSAPEPFYCAMLERTYEEFVAQGIPLRIVYSRDGMWATSGRVLWRRRIPPTRFVVVTRRTDD